MARCRNLFSGVVVSVGLVCAWITAGQAAVYDSLSAWNLAADPDFVLSAPAVGFEFFGACPYLDGGNCAATGSTTDPFASDASPSGEQTFINDNVDMWKPGFAA